MALITILNINTLNHKRHPTYSFILKQLYHDNNGVLMPDNVNNNNVHRNFQTHI